MFIVTEFNSIASTAAIIATGEDRLLAINNFVKIFGNKDDSNYKAWAEEIGEGLEASDSYTDMGDSWHVMEVPS